MTSANANGVSLLGGSGNSTLSASGGTKITIFGGTGNDSLTSSNANGMTMIGGSGPATLSASGGTNITIFGGSGKASLTSSNGNNVSMVGGSGSSTLSASGGTNITIFGGSGNASMNSVNGNGVSMLGGSGSATLSASGGTNITIFGGTGNDSLSSANSNSVTMIGGSGNSTLTASGGTNITIFGGTGNDSMSSANGNGVSMIGGSGNATLTASGGTGVTIFGGAGSDLLASSNDVAVLMTGGAGSDVITSADDSNAVLTSGSLSNDRLAVTDGNGVTAMGGAGNDTLSAAGGTGISLNGLDGDNLYQLTGTPADPLDVALNDLGTFGVALPQIDGFSDGVNTIAFPGVSSGITLDLSNASLGTVPGPAQEQQVAAGLTLSLTGYFQNVIGTTGANWIEGDPAANMLQGQGGSDTLIAGTGPATLVAGQGSDVLMGGSGGTTYSFAGTGLGSVTVVPASNTSNDTLDFSQLGGGVTFDMTSAAAQPVSPAAGLTLTVTNPLGITGVVGSAFDNAITGNARDDVSTVGGGNDTITGGGGNDTYVFNAGSHGTKVLDETPATHNTLDFHAFDGPVNVNLTQTGPQVVSPGSLTLTLSPPTAFDSLIGSRFTDTLVGNDRGDTLIGGGGDDSITTGSGANYIQTGITQVVYLDFDAGSVPGYHVYTQDERDAIQSRLEAIYKDFSYVFTQDPTQAAQLSQMTGGQYATLEFNVGVYPGASHKLDTDHIDLGGLATVNINPALGSSPDLVTDTSANVIGLTATIAAHELGHFSGLEHADSFGPIGSGIYSGVTADESYPNYTGSFGAVDTPSDVMASPDSVNSPLIDAAGPTQLGERDALHLAFDDSGTLLRAQDLTGLAQPVSVIPGVTSAIVLGALPPLAVPNTLIVPGTTGYGQTFQAVALGVEGTIATPGQEDFYAIAGHAGEVMSFEVASQYNTLNPSPFQPELEVLDSSGKRLAYSVQDFEKSDPVIYDLTLPADGTYYVGVDAYFHQATGDYKLLMYSLTAGTGGTPQGNGTTVTSSGGNDTLVGSSGNDTITYTAGAVGQVTIDTGSGNDVLDLRQAPQVTYTRAGDPTLGTLTVIGQVATTTSLTSDLPSGSTYGQAVTFTATLSADVGGLGTPTGSVQFEVDNVNYGSPETLNKGTVSFSTSSLTAGSHTITAVYTSDNPAFANSQNSLSFDVATATLTVTANNVSILYGSSLPSLTANYSGFVNGDTPSSLTTPVELSTSATSSSPVGVYALSASGASDPNYTITFVNGSLTIFPLPVSKASSLPARETSDTFTVHVADGNPSGSVAAGIASVDLYVSVNGGAFTLAQTLSTDPTAVSGVADFTFTGSDRNTYYFHSIAHSDLGAIESKSSTLIEATTYVPDLNPPVTHVLTASPAYAWSPFPASIFSGLTASSHSNGVFTLDWAGADPDQPAGGTITSLSIYEEIDGSSTATLVGTVTPGSPTAVSYQGTTYYVYSGSMTCPPLGDGQAHNYSFYSLGTDDLQMQQAVPSAADLTFTGITYTTPLSAALTVEKGIQERSYVRYLDVDFNQTLSSSSALQQLNTGLAGSSPSKYVELRWYGENLTSSSTSQGSVNLFAGSTATLTLSGSTLSIDFGAKGITSLLTENNSSGTGSPTTAFGDGWYALGVDPYGNPSQNTVFWLPFFRLLGDVNGDGKVTGPTTSAGTDEYIVNQARGQSGTLLNADVNGDGYVNTTDLQETIQAVNHSVGTTAPQVFPQFQLFAGPTGSGTAPLLTTAQVQSVLPQAIAAWEAAGLNALGVRQLEQVNVEVADLGGNILGLEDPGLILINQTAAGYGWYTATSQASNQALGVAGAGGQRLASTASPAAGKVDLLTVLEHELGHVIGLGDNGRNGDLLDMTLGLGMRRSPTAADMAALAPALRAAAPGLVPSLAANLLSPRGLASSLLKAAGNDQLDGLLATGESPIGPADLDGRTNTHVSSVLPAPITPRTGLPIVLNGPAASSMHFAAVPYHPSNQQEQGDGDLVLVGGEGTDILISGHGTDMLIGGFGGADVPAGQRDDGRTEAGTQVAVTDLALLSLMQEQTEGEGTSFAEHESRSVWTAARVGSNWFFGDSGD